MSGISKLTADRNQRILLDLVSKPGNDVCADCKARAPRWASHNLGIFICMNCASIHRKIGTHVTKVKSVTMDSWSREQVEAMKSIGNVVSNAKYNPNEARNPPPANREESERDSELEKFIRCKYEFKRFMDKSGNNTTSTIKAAPPARAQSTPATTSARRPSFIPPIPTSSTTNPTVSSRPPEARPYSAATAPPAPAAPRSQPPMAPRPAMPLPPMSVPAPAPQSPPNTSSNHPVWNDIMSLTVPSQPASSMLSQFQPSAPQGQFHQPSFATHGGAAGSFGVTSPSNPFPLSMINHPPGRSASLPPPANIGNPFQTHKTQNTQALPSTGNPFKQQPHGFAGQTTATGVSFQSSPSALMQAQPSFGQATPSSFSHSYTPPSAFPQQQQQQFAPSSFPQQFMHTSMQQPTQAFSQQQQLPQQQQQPPMQGNNPFGAPMQWHQQPPGFPAQPQYGQWGGM